MALKDIIGQERAITILRGCIANDRIPHAFLSAGDEGIGKKLTAINFVKALHCRKTTMKEESEEVMELLPITSPLPDSIAPSLPDSCDMKIRNPNIEIRNNFEIQMIKISKTGLICLFGKF